MNLDFHGKVNGERQANRIIETMSINSYKVVLVLLFSFEDRPEVNNTLIGRSTPTTSNTTLRTDNKTGEAEPLGSIK